MYRYQLEKGTKKYTCPACGGRRRFRRVVDTATGEYLGDNVGLCDRSNSCGYSYTSKDYFRDNGGGKGPLDIKPVVPLPVEYDYHDPVWLDRLQIVKTHSDGHHSNLYPGVEPLQTFLISLYKYKRVDRVFEDYRIGRFINQYGRKYTMLPYISHDGKFARGKLIQFDPVTGKRSKERFGTSSLRYELGLKKDWNYDNRVFFGEHLQDAGGQLVAIVESEKTALIGAITHPEWCWMATGTKGSLSVAKIARVHYPKTRIALFPDGDALEAWRKIGGECRSGGLRVGVSSILEENTTPEERAAGIDIADLLIREQRHRLEELAEREAVKAEACGGL